MLFVSHNMAASESLCGQAVLLERGHMKSAGPAASVIKSYLSESMEANQATTWDDPESAPGNSVMRIRRISVTDGNDPGSTSLSMKTGDSNRNRVHGRCNQFPAAHHLPSAERPGNHSFSRRTWSKPRVDSAGSYRAICRIPGKSVEQRGLLPQVVHRGERKTRRSIGRRT